MKGLNEDIVFDDVAVKHKRFLFVAKLQKLECPPESLLYGDKNSNPKPKLNNDPNMSTFL